MSHTKGAALCVTRKGPETASRKEAHDELDPGTGAAPGVAYRTPVPRPGRPVRPGPHRRRGRPGPAAAAEARLGSARAHAVAGSLTLAPIPLNTANSSGSAGFGSRSSALYTDKSGIQCWHFFAPGNLGRPVVAVTVRLCGSR